MISTHSPKLFNARIDSNALAAEILHPVPNGIICSQTVNIKNRFWSAPKNAADIKKWREIIAELPANHVMTTSLPAIRDPHLKQVLLPNDNWREDEYVSVSPVASMGVINETYLRLGTQSMPFKKWVIQPTPAALANHGDVMLKQGGIVRLMRRGLVQIKEPNIWKGSFVQLTARCDNMNISSGMMSVGFPAISAIGGFIHSIERKVGIEMEFACGFKSLSWSEGVPRCTLHKTSSQSSIGRMKGRAIEPKPGYTTEEITATGQIVILIRSSADQNDLKTLVKVLNSSNRLAGGRLFDIDVSIVENGVAPEANYIFDASTDIVCDTQTDALQASLNMYKLGGEWREGLGWYQKGNGYTLNHSGYAYLEEPCEKTNVRNNYHHAWAEAAFSLINQSAMSSKAWWKRESSKAGVFWRNAHNTNPVARKKARKNNITGIPKSIIDSIKDKHSVFKRNADKPNPVERKEARKHNITGIPKLSIGLTKNQKGVDITRYTVNFKKSDGKPSNKSFYFGANTSQRDSFLNAIAFMKDNGLYDGSTTDALSVYQEYKHETLA
ncbi:hypothetical protein V6259_12745 [Marinomonas sp. TI.3.20]|uniref:hypothetical protein n=1 Tax=Marinomonas sp. TI.3.20 TaxID=3121296 RepID=UPI00311E79EB